MAATSQKETVTIARPKLDVQKISKYIDNGNTSRREKLSYIKEKITAVLVKHPQGIDVEKLRIAFKEEFGEELHPSTFGFFGVKDMLKSMHDIVDMKMMESNNHVLLLSTSSKTKSRFYFSNFSLHLFNLFVLLS